MAVLEVVGEKRIVWSAPEGCPSGLETREVHAGKSDGQSGPPIELAIARWTASGRVTRESLAKLHALRVNKRATAVVLAVELADNMVVTFGPNPGAEPLAPLPIDQAQRLFQAILDEPSALMARARLAALTAAIDSTSIPGVKNSGLFANHELRVGVPLRPDWRESCGASLSLLLDRGTALISKLGYSVKRAGAHALVLTGDGPRPHAIAVMLDEREGFDSESPRFAISPVAYGLTMAEREGVPWLIMARGSQLRLYPARVDLGVGRKGLAETFFELDLPYLTIENAGYLRLLFSSTALAEGGSAYQIMESSAQYAVALGERLRDKVYEEIIPDLSLAVAEQMIDLGYEMDAEGLDLAYQITLRIFFRLLFQVYAEDRGLLPYKENDRYTRNALKTLAADFVENPDEEFEPQSAALWDDLAQVWNVIDAGDRSWGVPAYNGGLFSSDEDLHPHGALISRLRIHNDVMGPVLRALLLDDGDDGEEGPIDFRSLSVREFGTIYEGLLESSLGLAEVDLTLDDKGTWLPAKKKSDEIYAYAGQVYFHNTSGQRKGTGSYFTPSFVVEHLLERSLDPTLDDHLERVAALIKKGDQAGAADLFFDFKVADLAMGSGHFLTAAIDHIEAKMAAFLAEDGNQIPGVAKELSLLFQAAKEAVGPDAPEPEPSSLLRRQIARRCVYGLDINPIAVELARVSIWIHTFVRGLPMSSLDHNLVCGNSLTGIGSVEEALDVLVPKDAKGQAAGQMSIFDAPIRGALANAREVLVDVANLPELSRKETQAASKAVQKARKEAETAKLLFDAAVLTRIGREGLVAMTELDAIVKTAATRAAQDELAPLQPAHMPVLFPEVFLRDNAGFDALIGNPPWEEVVTEELKFWTAHVPGLKSMKPGERTKAVEFMRETRVDLVQQLERRVESDSRIRACLLAGPFPDMGTGDPDLYKAFAWRNLQLLSRTGRAGIVLPRTAFTARGSVAWRQKLVAGGLLQELTTLVNSGNWVFEGVHPQYQIALAIVSGAPLDGLQMSGPFFSRGEFDRRTEEIRVAHREIESWSATFSIPAISSRRSADIFTKMSEAPTLGRHPDFEFRPVAEVSASLDKKKFYFETDDRPDGALAVFGGRSFDLWAPDTGEYFGWAREATLLEISRKRHRQIKLKSSAFYGLGEDWAQDESTLPYKRPRIAFRDITRATDSRTVRCALVPPNVILNNKAPYLFRVRGEPSADAFILGVLSSTILDWQARQVVELGLNPSLMQALRIPLRGDQFENHQIARIAGTLAAIDNRYAEWASVIGVSVGSVRTEEQQRDMEAELDALVSHLYGLTREQVEHIFTTFHRGWDYKPRLEAVLGHFDRIGGEK